jgi:hypothetical protein
MYSASLSIATEDDDALSILSGDGVCDCTREGCGGCSFFKEVGMPDSSCIIISNYYDFTV